MSARVADIGAKTSGSLGSRVQNLTINRNPATEPGFFFGGLLKTAGDRFFGVHASECAKAASKAK